MNQKERIKTARENIDRLEGELNAAKAELRKAFSDQYPEGRFVICRWSDDWWKRKQEQIHQYGIYWAPENSQLGKFFGKETSHPHGPHGYGIFDAGHGGRNHGWSNRGKQTFYDSLNKMLKAAAKFNLPQNLIDAFMAECGNRIAKKEVTQKETVENAIFDVIPWNAGIDDAGYTGLYY